MEFADLYLLLKSLHIGAVALSGSFFLVRAGWMLRAPAMLQRRWVRVAPHIVDTVLLGAGVGLAVLAHFNPVSQPWLAAKLIALVGYIGFGTVALKRGRTRGVRIAALIVAIALFIYMVGTAVTHDPAFLLPT